MGIPTKGSRIIKINQQEYRWLVTSGKDHVLTLAIELKDSPGQLFLTYFDKHQAYLRDENGDWHSNAQLRKIGPGLVRKIIETSLQKGWEPDTKGKSPFILDSAPSLFPIIEKEILPEDAIVPGELLCGYLYDLLDKVSLCPQWRKKILEAPIHYKFEAPIPPPGFGDKQDHEEIKKMNLKFTVFNDGISPCGGWFVIGVQSEEFPSEAVYSTNCSSVWIGV
ncbi:MAG: hypothetical protein GY756_02450 [bacterium]|nr:hypothetical protein [bacterium]